MADEAYYKRLWNYDDDSYDYWDEMVSADWDTPDIYGTGSYYPYEQPDYASQESITGTAPYQPDLSFNVEMADSSYWYDQEQSFLNQPEPGWEEREEQQQGFDMLAYEEEYGKSWVDELQESVSGAARTSREFLSGLTGIPTGDIAKIAGYFMPRKGEKTRSSFQGPQRRKLPTASLRGKPPMSAAGRSPSTDEVIKNMIASNRTTSTAANSARSQTANGQAAIFKNLTDKLGEYSEIQTGATKPKGPNIPQSEIRLTPRREIT